MQKIFLNRTFSIVKLPARELFSQKKSKMIIFHLKCTKSKHNCFVCIAERQTLKIVSQICFSVFKVFGLPPLHMQKCLFKMIFGHNYLFSEPIFKLFVALFRTHELQKDDMVIFFFWCFR